MAEKVDARFKVGETVRVPFRLYSAVIEVDCVLLDNRALFGRTEWLIVPVKGGDEPAWVTEGTLLGETAGARLSTK